MTTHVTPVGPVQHDGPHGHASLVTGAARGLGLSIARRLAQRGDTVVLTDLDESMVSNAAATLAAEGLTVFGDVLDVGSPASISTVVGRWAAELDLDTIVNNAGMAFAAATVDTTPEQWDRLMSVNLRGPFLVTQAAVPHLLAAGGGTVVNVASTSSFTASSQPMAAYDVSKAGIRMLTQSLAREFGAHGIRVNAVAPGTMDTALVRGLLSEEGTADLVGTRIPLNRLAETREVADAVAFLSSAEASYITGHTLVVDGGWLA